jgi:hypothetical protein
LLLFDIPRASRRRRLKSKGAYTHHYPFFTRQPLLLPGSVGAQNSLAPGPNFCIVTLPVAGAS